MDTADPSQHEPAPDEALAELPALQPAVPAPELPWAPCQLATPGHDAEVVPLLGVRVANVTRAWALDRLESMIRHWHGRAQSVYFVDAHTLNLAAADRGYRDLLNRADYVFGDGMGVRWAATIRGRRMRDNVNGADLAPALLVRGTGEGFSYFLLGSNEESIQRAAAFANEQFPAWRLAGHHHGYLADPAVECQAIEAINAAEPDLLLVGMGSPRQERWIDRHQHELCVPVSLGVGGLLDYWAGNIERAPVWLRRVGLEWLGLLLQQPHTGRRYLVGTPLFLARAVMDAFRSGIVHR